MPIPAASSALAGEPYLVAIHRSATTMSASPLPRPMAARSHEWSPDDRKKNTAASTSAMPATAEKNQTPIDVKAFFAGGECGDEYSWDSLIAFSGTRSAR